LNNQPWQPDQLRTKYFVQIAESVCVVDATSARERAVVSDLMHCQKVVEWMLADGRTLEEVEEYVERCALDGMEKAGLWMLAWAHRDQATQLRAARERLALVSSLRSKTA